MTALVAGLALLLAVPTYAINEEGAALLKKLDDDPTVIKHESGLRYRVLEKGNTSHPALVPESRLNISYLGKTTDGNAFDGTHKPKVVIPTRLFPGLKQALLLMSPGSKWEVIIPPELAFGDDEYGKIPAGSVLQFDIEVHNVEDPPEGIWKAVDWAMRNPGKVLVAGIFIKFLLDWLLGVTTPTGMLKSLEAVAGKKENPKLSCTVTVDGDKAGTIVIEMYEKMLPVTVALVKALCSKTPKKGPKHKFENQLNVASRCRVPFASTHSVEAVDKKTDVIGLPESKNGYLSHDSRYLVSMANVAKLETDSIMEIFVLTGAAEIYDGTHCVFGQIVEGKDVFDQVEAAHKARKTIQLSKFSLSDGKKSQ